MENIDPKLLRAFLYAAEERGIPVAARRLGLSADTVSSRIRTLERRLGTRLFDRNGGALALAAAGSRLLPAAREIVEMNDRLFKRARRAASAQGPARSDLPPSAVSAGPKSPL